MTVVEEDTFGTPLENYGTPWGVRYNGLQALYYNTICKKGNYLHILDLRVSLCYAERFHN